MNRRSFLKGLACLPCLGFLKGKDVPSEPEYGNAPVNDALAKALSETNDVLLDMPNGPPENHICDYIAELTEEYEDTFFRKPMFICVGDKTYKLIDTEFAERGHQSTFCGCHKRTFICNVEIIKKKGSPSAFARVVYECPAHPGEYIELF